MFIELVDTLRCVNPHEDNWLVGSFDRIEGRRIITGTLGCPSCGASYPIRDGVAWIGAAPGASLPDEREPDDIEAEAMRLAALLDLRDPGTRAVVAGTLGHAAHAVVAMTQAELLLLDPPASVRAGDGVSIVRGGGTVPLASASMAGVALDARTTPAIASAVQVVRDKGRLLAPASTPVPEEIRVLARDARHWVGERRVRTSAPVPLTLSRR